MSQEKSISRKECINKIIARDLWEVLQLRRIDYISDVLRDEYNKMSVEELTFALESRNMKPSPEPDRQKYFVESDNEGFGDYEFQVTLRGYGESALEAWQNAYEAFNDEPGTYKSYSWEPDEPLPGESGEIPVNGEIELQRVA